MIMQMGSDEFHKFPFFWGVCDGIVENCTDEPELMLEHFSMDIKNMYGFLVILVCFARK